MLSFGQRQGSHNVNGYLLGGSRHVLYTPSTVGEYATMLSFDQRQGSHNVNGYPLGGSRHGDLRDLHGSTEVSILGGLLAMLACSACLVHVVNA